MSGTEFRAWFGVELLVFALTCGYAIAQHQWDGVVLCGPAALVCLAAVVLAGEDGAA